MWTQSAAVAAAVAVVSVVTAFGVAVLRLRRRASRAREAWAVVVGLLEERRRLAGELSGAVSALHIGADDTVAKLEQACAEVEHTATPAIRSRSEGVLQSCLQTLFVILDAVDAAVWAGTSGLRASIEVIDEEIQLARLRYNAAVREYNGELGTVRGRLAGLLGRMRPMEYFELRPPGA